jgi:dTDP-4-dehydrorhamnose reductase
MSVHRKGKPQRPNLMVTGASGTLGHWICRLAMNAWSVHGIHWQHPIDIAGVNAIKADLTRTAELKKLFSVIQPQAVIHAAAIAQPVLCEADPQATQGINMRVPQFLSALCADQGVPYVFISTDLVFNGLNAPYGEQCPVSPVTIYGRQKAQAEAGVLDAYPGALVCRMPLMFGFGPMYSGNFSIQMLSAIQKRQTIQLLTDEFRTPVDFQSAAQGVLNLLGRAQGVLHLGGRTRVSRYELGLFIARQMDIAPTVLEPVTIDALSLGVARSPDCTMNSQKAYALGYDPMPLHSAVKRFVYQFKVISDTKKPI